MLSALSAAGVEFLVVGAYALAAHGLPRATGDLDIWIRPARENVHRVFEALRSFGAPLFDLSEADLLRDDTVFQIGIVPNRIDLLTGISGGIDFAKAWNDRLDADVEGLRVPVIGRKDLLRNKEATGREQDQVDASRLRRLGET